MTKFERWLLFADQIYDATRNEDFSSASGYREGGAFFQSLFCLNWEETICLAIAEKLLQNTSSETITEDQVVAHFYQKTPKTAVSKIFSKLTAQDLLNVISRSGEIKYDLSISYYFELGHILCNINLNKQ